jgi:hypothetical protein
MQKANGDNNCLILGIKKKKQVLFLNISVSQTAAAVGKPVMYSAQFATLKFKLTFNSSFCHDEYS